MPIYIDLDSHQPINSAEQTGVGISSKSDDGRTRERTKQRRDDLDEYWMDAIWQRTAHGRLTWRRYGEVFAVSPAYTYCVRGLCTNMAFEQ